ncbi:MAG: 2-hydroxyacid dehydrogenase [Candidatus Poribacteria bacterium]|nr:2-hydroxyacid dehydrogenase [Candidatus Poribacteria bacterium]
MPKVIFFTFLSQEITPLLTQYAPPGFEVSVHPNTLTDEEKIPLVQDADFLILFPGRISERVLRSARRLKLIQLVSAGYESMDRRLCRELGIPVTNNGGTNSIDVAEHTITLILSFYRRLVELDSNVRADRWHDIDTGLSTYTINGKTVGIVGMGNIGRKVARLLSAFGARVLYYDEYPLQPEMEKEFGVTRVTLADLLQDADIVTVHVPLTKGTHGLIGRHELSLMKSTALLVNTCRGPVVNEAALIETLKARRIQGGALDVLEKEPPDPDNPILQLDNVLLTPHAAGVTYDTWRRRGAFVFQNLQRVWDGQPPLAVVREG